MVSTKGYWDMINEHIINSDLEYLETKNIEEKRKELKNRHYVFGYFLINKVFL